MKTFACSILAISLLLVGCGANSTATTSELQTIINVFKSLQPATAQNVKTLSVAQLTTVLNTIASSGKLSSAENAVLTDPKNQQILQGIFQLAQGGSASTQMAAYKSMIAAAGGTTAGLSDPVSQLLQVFNTIAPIIELFDPSIAPYVAIAQEILPLVQTFLSFLNASAAGH